LARYAECDAKTARKLLCDLEVLGVIRADLGVMVWRKTGDAEAEIAVVKSRYYRELGTSGAVKGVFYLATARLTITDDGGMFGQS
jgi:hypothetical protein